MLTCKTKWSDAATLSVCTLTAILCSIAAPCANAGEKSAPEGSGSVQFTGWMFLSSTTSKSETPVCVMSSVAKVHEKVVSLKFFRGKKFLEILLYNNVWNFKEGSVVRGTVTFSADDLAQFKFQGHGHNLVGFLGPENGNIGLFLTAIIHYQKMKVTFEDILEEPWVISGSGAEKPGRDFAECSISMMKK